MSLLLGRAEFKEWEDAMSHVKWEKGRGGTQKDKDQQPPEASMDKILPRGEIARKKRTWETNSRFASGCART